MLIHCYSGTNRSDRRDLFANAPRVFFLLLLLQTLRPRLFRPPIRRVRLEIAQTSISTS